MPEGFDQQFWEGRYGESGSLWARNPNPQLVTEATALSPGTALDVGCGEGADAIWLASHSWRVTAVDFASTALNRARERAAAYAAEIDEPIDWVRADITEWTPRAAHFDLVTSHYVHLAESRQEFLRRLGAAVRPGGVLLVVDHHPSEERPSGLAPSSNQTVSAEHIAEGLDPEKWEITVAETRTRTVTVPGEHAHQHGGHGGHGGHSQHGGHGEHDEGGEHESTLTDVILAARRRT